MAAGLAVYVVAAAIAYRLFAGPEIAGLDAAWGSLFFATCGYGGFALLAVPAALYSLVASAPKHALDTPSARTARWLVLAATVSPYAIFRWVL